MPAWPALVYLSHAEEPLPADKKMEPRSKEVRCNLTVPFLCGPTFPLFAYTIPKGSSYCLYEKVRMPHNRCAIIFALYARFSSLGVVSAASWQYITPRLFLFCIKLSAGLGPDNQRAAPKRLASFDALESGSNAFPRRELQCPRSLGTLGELLLQHWSWF